jgi:hypothetical protein
MSKTKLKGLWVPMEVIADNNLSDKEKFIYSLLLVYSTKKGSTTITNKIISQMFFVSKTQVSKLISSLKRKNYIDTNIVRNESKQIINRTIIPMKLFANTHVKKDKTPIQQSNITPIKQKFTDKKIYYKNYLKNNISNRMETSAEYEKMDYDNFYSN